MYPECFLMFWEAYPVKRGKLDALKAWKKINPPPLALSLMIDAIQDQKRSKQWRDGFIPYPAKWLRQGRWLDELGYDDFHHAKL